MLYADCVFPTQHTTWHGCFSCPCVLGQDLGIDLFRIDVSLVLFLSMLALWLH